MFPDQKLAICSPSFWFVLEVIDDVPFVAAMLILLVFETSMSNNISAVAAVIPRLSVTRVSEQSFFRVMVLIRL